MQTQQYLVLTIFILLLACSQEAIDPWNGFAPFEASYTTDQLQRSEVFLLQGLNRGGVMLNELSGMASSEVNKGMLWAHNDSNNGNAIYLIDKESAVIRATFQLSGVDNHDWEDMAVGPGPVKGMSYVYLGDIGDNEANRKQYIIYRFPEPLFGPALEGKIVDINPSIEKIIFNYPDNSHDSETLMLDPISLDLYVVTKFGLHSELYAAKYPQLVDSLLTLTKVGTFGFREATAGDISPDGSRVLIKTYDQILFWKKTGSEPLWKLLAQVPLLAPYDPIEIQGEAIAFDEGGYFTCSEKTDKAIPGLYFYRRK